ncbi:MAG: hypothetical protein M3Z84_08835, partial [Actinomycetota bacterium]|nr:hypothetical protein [Actinomycetota bacterium]
MSEPVFGGQLSTLVCQGGTSALDVLAAGVEFFGSSLQFDELDKPGLIEVHEAAVFAVGGFGFSLQACQLRLEELVVGCGSAAGHGRLACQEDLGAGEGLADLVEDEVVEGVGADATFGTSVLLAAGSEGVVVAAVVVAVQAPSGCLRLTGRWW